MNNCPLHSQYPNLFTDSADFEVKCKLAKDIRVIIAEQYPGILKFNGQTKKEFAAKTRISPEEKEKIISRTKKFRFISAYKNERSEEGVRLPASLVSGDKSPKIRVV